MVCSGGEFAVRHGKRVLDYPAADVFTALHHAAVTASGRDATSSKTPLKTIGFSLCGLLGCRLMEHHRRYLGAGVCAPGFQMAKKKAVSAGKDMATLSRVQ